MPTKTYLPNFIKSVSLSPCAAASTAPCRTLDAAPLPCPSTRPYAFSAISDRIRRCAAAICARTPPAAAADTAPALQLRAEYPPSPSSRMHMSPAAANPPNSSFTTALGLYSGMPFMSAEFLTTPDVNTFSKNQGHTLHSNVGCSAFVHPWRRTRYPISLAYPWIHRSIRSSRYSPQTRSQVRL